MATARKSQQSPKGDTPPTAAMNNEVVTLQPTVFNFDYSCMPDAGEETELRAIVVSIRNNRKQAAEAILNIGQNLIRAKEITPRGAWRDWLDKEFSWDERSAQRFMAVADMVQNDNLSDLEPFDVSSLYELTKKSLPPVVKDVALELAKSGQPIRHKAIMEARKLVEVGNSNSRGTSEEREIEETKAAVRQALVAPKTKSKPGPRLVASRDSAPTDSLAMAMREPEDAPAPIEAPTIEVSPTKPSKSPNPPSALVLATPSDALDRLNLALDDIADLRSTLMDGSIANHLEGRARDMLQTRLADAVQVLATLAKHCGKTIN